MNKKQINAALEKIAKGDDKALEQLYIQTKNGVYSFVYSYFRNDFDAQDAMQTVYLKIKRYAAKYAPGTNGLAWILQIAKNTALDELEKRKTRKKYIDENGLSAANEQAEDFTGRTDAGSVTDIMNRVLDEEERQIVTLHVIWGYKHRETAEFLGCPVGTVTSKYKRAAEKIKKAWEDEERE